MKARQEREHVSGVECRKGRDPPPLRATLTIIVIE